jgi:hypothetical protein
MNASSTPIAPVDEALKKRTSTGSVPHALGDNVAAVARTFTIVTNAP